MQMNKLLKFIYFLILYINYVLSEDFIDSVPIPPYSTTGMIIDGGSGGSRLHVYNWAPRIFQTLPPTLSYPTTNEFWTQKMSPGIAYMKTSEDVAKHLAPLIDFAKNVLKGKENEFWMYPIYFKATGGMRELNLIDREQIMEWTRQHLMNSTFNPFFFRTDMARVISGIEYIYIIHFIFIYLSIYLFILGEEEAIFSWTAINFLKDTLLPNSAGTGTATSNNTWGTLDLGGASLQIAFYVLSQDISENLFKLQIGGQKHWNVYTKSYLSFGHVSARRRYLAFISDKAIEYHKYEKDRKANRMIILSEMNKMGRILEDFNVSYYTSNNNKTTLTASTHCFPSGYKEKAWGTFKNESVYVSGPSYSSDDQFERCVESMRYLLEKQHSGFCNRVYDHQCGIDGVYQPTLPSGQSFIGTSSFIYSWEILLLNDTVSLNYFDSRAKVICSMSYQEVEKYFDGKNLELHDDKLSDLIPYFCFLSAYTHVLLEDGFGFTSDQNLTVLDKVNGNKVGWALGAILYEINSLPWELDIQPKHNFAELIIAASVGCIVGAIATFFLSKELLHSRNSRLPIVLNNDDTQEKWELEIKQYSPFQGIKKGYTKIPDKT
jgi:hypothetical protein